jgi:hypothetical protein
MPETMSKTSISARLDIHQLQELLAKKGFHTIVLNNDKEVKEFIHQHIPDNTPVGLGDSITTCKLNLRNILAAKGSRIFYSWNGSENYNRSIDTFENPERPEYYITRITALTSDGRILIKDYEKRAASEDKFPRNVYAFVGLNRIVNEFNPAGSTESYPVLVKKPSGIKFTIALLPFLDY